VTLVLFDIDGTLIQTGRAGMRGMNRAFGDLFGAPDALDGVPVAGRTDRAIVSEVLAKIGVLADPSTIARVRDEYCRHLPAALADPASRPMNVLPGVPGLLKELESREDVVTALLTGNFVAGAEIKLGYFDLWTRFAFGAFGDAHSERRALVPVAVAEAVRHGHHTFAPERIVVIGDTPLDVDCAHAYGARAIAVATGMYSMDTLRDTQADLTVATLADVSPDWF
jgi:phosphoglycolate phosphatase